VDAQAIEFVQTGVGRQPGVEDQLLGIVPGPLLPEARKDQNGAFLVFLAQVGVPVAENVGLGVMDQEGQDPLLPSATLGNIVFFDQGVVAVERDRVEIEVEGGVDSCGRLASRAMSA